MHKTSSVKKKESKPFVGKFKGIGIALIYIIVFYSTVTIGYPKSAALFDPEMVLMRDFWSLYERASDSTNKANHLLSSDKYYAGGSAGEWEKLEGEARDVQDSLSNFSNEKKYKSVCAPFDEYLDSLLTVSASAKSLADTEEFSSSDESKYKELSDNVSELNAKLEKLNSSLKTNLQGDIDELKVNLLSDSIASPTEPAEIIAAVEKEENDKKTAEEEKRKKEEEAAEEKRKQEEEAKLAQDRLTAEEQRMAAEQEAQRKRDQQQQLALAKAAQEDAQRRAQKLKEAQDAAKKKAEAQKLNQEQDEPETEAMDETKPLEWQDSENLEEITEPGEEDETEEENLQNSQGSDSSFPLENQNIAYGDFILDISTGKLHQLYCPLLSQIDESNKSAMSGPLNLGFFDLCEECFK